MSAPGSVTTDAVAATTAVDDAQNVVGRAAAAGDSADETATRGTETAASGDDGAAPLLVEDREGSGGGTSGASGDGPSSQASPRGEDDEAGAGQLASASPEHTGATANVIHDRSVTIVPRDIQLARRIRGERV